ncbi:MAG: hypothetical protein JW862_14115 [Anaerolineales bacterium]|nr:hypothetical protein [Anaerolineales bacterium]
MNHQPFETWLLSDEPLETADALALAEHLATCQHCQQLQQAWAEVSDLFEHAPEVQPAPGFTERWQTRLQAEKQVDLAIRQRWQSWIGLILVANAAAMTLVLLGAGLLTTYDSPVQFLLAGIYRLSATVGLVSWFQSLVVPLLRTLPAIIPVGWWLVGLVFLMVVSLVWIFSLSRLVKFSSLLRRA